MSAVGGIGVAVAPSRPGNGARPRRRGGGGADAGGAGAALRGLGGVRRLSWRRGRALEGVGPPARLDAAGAGHRARGFRRRELFEPGGDVAVHHRGREVFRRDCGGDGQARKFEVVGVAGIRPLQQYLLSPEPGRTQAFDIAWDSVQRRWYDLYPDQVLEAHDGLHWTGPYKSWEARCAECHATGYTRNYQPASDTLRSRARRRSGSGCEACHGPGEAHEAWAKDPDGYDPARWAGLTPHGLTVDLAGSAEVQIEQCAGCHSRREDFARRQPAARHAVPRQLHAVAAAGRRLRGGRDDPGRGLRVRLVPAGEDVRARGPVQRLPRPAFAGAARPRGTRSARSATIAGRQPAVSDAEEGALRRSLAYLPCRGDTPAPRARAATCPSGSTWGSTTGATTASGCRGRTCRSRPAGRTPAPTATRTRTRPGRRRRSPSGFPRARTGGRASRPPSRRRAGIRRRGRATWSRWRGRGDTAGIVRATALDLLTPVADPGIADRVAPLLADPDPLVRAAAAGVQRAVPPDARLARLAPTLGDPARAVRVAAAKAMLGADPVGRRSDAARQALARATGEWQASIAPRQDFPETHMQIGRGGAADAQPAGGGGGLPRGGGDRSAAGRRPGR